MVVQHNLTAMNSNRMLGVTTSAQAKSTEKLSSGYKINRAADNAAGLSISEKMRKQIRGLTQASSNAQDGISAVQTAEGALNEVQDMLQRMNELAVQSANGTNSETDRQSIQDEINQLTTEIDRVSTTTKFNETYLLQGDARAAAKKSAAITGATVTGTDGGSKNTKVAVSLAEGQDFVAGKVTVGTVIAKADHGTLDLDNLSGALKTAIDDEAGAAAGLTLTYTAAVPASEGTPAKEATWTVGSTKYTASQLKEMGLEVGSTEDDIKITKSVEKADNIPTGMTVTTDESVGQLAKVAVGSEINVTLKKNTDGKMEVTTFDNAYVPKDLKFSLHVGADNSYDNKIEVGITAMSSTGLGLLATDGKLHVDGKDSTNADAAIDTIANALQKVSDQRSALGAIQNRLEHTIKNLDNVVENTTAAESQIRDTDMATEMVRYSNNNILAQAGQSMLAQANQSNQGVLSLLG